MLEFLIFACVVLPVLFGVAAYLSGGKPDGSRLLRRKLVPLGAGCICAAALLMAAYGSFSLPASSFFSKIIGLFIGLLDFVLLGVIFWIGWVKKHKFIRWLALLQLAGLAVMPFFTSPETPGIAFSFAADGLSIIMVLMVSVVGSLIAVYALPYMKTHEEQHEVKESRQARFFAIIFVFLGAMNGLVISNDLGWVYFFWEVTTLCSYLLIRHDGSEVAEKNAQHALLMNMLGGAAFIFALMFLQKNVGSLDLQYLLALGSPEGGVARLSLIPLALLCFAGLTKSAQAPFQSWLTGAMVAPTPVSALLHSSTMVKAGVYLVLRMAPAYAGTSLSTIVALIGGFSFISCAALAAGQSNSKKILAYSTISNLGLIIACAGINTVDAYSAAIFLMIFHAVSKGLLFLCVGSIEQRIGSRDIEDMRGLFSIMPHTALTTVIGIVTMMMPPFGMLIAKWMALESAVSLSKAMPLVVFMLALGSGLTMLFWGRWAGLLLGSSSAKMELPREGRDKRISTPMRVLMALALILSLLSPLLYAFVAQPIALAMMSVNSIEIYHGVFSDTMSLFSMYPILILLLLGFWVAFRMARHNPSENKTPYMSGIYAERDGKPGFTGPLNTFVEATASNYYLADLFGEEKLSRGVNVVATVLLILLLGGIL